MKTLANKVVAITGAGSGIGRALALRCVRAGAHVAISDVNQAGLDETAEAGRKAAGAGRVFAARLDVGDRDAIYAWAANVRKELGPADVIVNNAGVSLSQTVAEMRDEDFRWLMDINFWGVVHGTRAFLPHLQERPEGHVVNISSVFGIIAVPTQSAYNASKFAVRGFTESLRMELAGTKVRVTCVHPGGIDTNIVANGRHYQDPSGNRTDVATLAKSFRKDARTSPDEAARQIVEAILHDQPRLLIGVDAMLIDRMQRLLPATYDRLVGAAMKLRDRREKRAKA
jgi:NAD(P)-dependent dehydrogenase (short-subunit alcohol dehydrogenase family)